MNGALIVGAATLGLLGTAHCAAMCAAPCAALAGGHRAAGWAFQATRAAGYAALGGAVAGGVALLAAWARWAPALKPAWVLLQAAMLVLGLWMLWHARQPRWRWAVAGVPTAAGAVVPMRWQGSAARPLTRAALGGGLWWAWPCGLLQSALLLAALADGPAGGALVMASFALASSPGLWLGPWLWRRLSAARGRDRAEAFAARAAGLMVALGAAWALGHGLWQDVAAYCAARF